LCGTAIIDPIDKHIGNKIRECRVRAKMSLQQTSEILSVSPGQLSRYESGENRINAGSLFYLARGFELPVSWFYEGFDISNERKRHLENVVHNSLKNRVQLINTLLTNILYAVFVGITTKLTDNAVRF
jgi:Predicted transcriptional regulators